MLQLKRGHQEELDKLLQEAEKKLAAGEYGAHAPCSMLTPRSYCAAVWWLHYSKLFGLLSGTSWFHTDVLYMHMCKGFDQPRHNGLCNTDFCASI